MGELNVEKQRITWRKFREMGSRNYSSSIVANSRSSLYLRNMVELVVDFTRDTLLVVNSSETCTIRAEYHTLILIISFVRALTSDGQEVRGCHWTEDESQGFIWWIIFRSVYELEEYQRAEGEKSRYLALCEALHSEILCHFKEW